MSANTRLLDLEDVATETAHQLRALAAINFEELNTSSAYGVCYLLRRLADDLEALPVARADEQDAAPPLAAAAS